MLENDGGEPCEYRFVYGTDTTCGQSTPWSGSWSNGQVFGHIISGLTDETEYHYMIQTRNSVGTALGSDMTFTTGEPVVGWVPATGFSDSTGKWEDGMSGYDDMDGSHARCYHDLWADQWGPYLYLTRPELATTGIRFKAKFGEFIDKIDVDVNRDGVWEDVYTGAFADRQWEEKHFSAGTVSQARVRFHVTGTNCGLYWELVEFDFLYNHAPTVVNETAQTDLETEITVNVLENDSDSDGHTIILSDIVQPGHGTATFSGDSITYTPEDTFMGTDTITYTVTDQAGASTDGTLTVKVGIDDDIYEENDTQTDAADLSSRITDNSFTIENLAVRPSDEDWYKIQTTENTGFILECLFTQRNDGRDDSDLDLAVFSADGSVIVESYSGSDNEKVAFYTAANQPVFIRVLGYDNSEWGGAGPSWNTYGLVLSPLPADDTYEENDSFGSARNVTSEMTGGSFSSEALFCGPSDPDWFSADVTEAASVTVNCIFTERVDEYDDSDLDIEVYNSSHQLLGSSLSATDNETVEFDLSQADSIYVKVYGADNTEYGGSKSWNNYSLEININYGNTAPVAHAKTVTTDEDNAAAVTLSGSDVENDPLTFEVATQPANGSLSGTAPNLTYTPAANYNGSDSFTYRAYDGTQYSAPATVSITVNAVNDAPFADNLTATVNEDESVGVMLEGTDHDNDPLAYEILTQPQLGTLSGTAPDLTYSPLPDASGTDSFTYKVNDGSLDSNTATVNITIAPVNDAPEASDDTATTDEDTAVTIDVLANDTDVENDTLVVQSVTQPSNGTVTNNSTNVSYTPNTGFSGTDTFTYTVTDGNGGTDTATVSVAVNDTNQAPVALDQSLSTDEDTALTITLSATDNDNDTLTYTVLSDPANGTLSGTAPSLTFTPAANWHGTTSFTFNVNDGTVDSNTATVSIDVAAVNDAPVAMDDSVATNEDTPASFDVMSNDTDVENDTLQLASLPNLPANGIAAISADKTRVEYTPNADYYGSDSFTYTVTDGTGNSNTATVSVTVNAVNDAPVADSQSLSTPEDTVINVTLTASDTENDTLTFSVISTPGNGNLSGTAPNLTFTPNADWNGIASFTFKANDGTVDSDPATVSITVTPVNDAPQAEDLTIIIQEDEVVSFTLTGSDPENAPLTFSVVSDPEHGALSGIAPNMTYTPAANYSGTDSFTYTVNDGELDSALAAVTVHIIQVNNPPVANDDSVSTSEDTAVTINVLANDTDEEGASLSISSFTQPSFGTVEISNETFVYTPSDNFYGEDFFSYSISDGTNISENADVLITVSSVNDTPVAYDDYVYAEDGTEISINVLSNDEDPDNDTLSIDSVTNPSNGTFTQNGSMILYTANLGYDGEDTFSYTISDGNGATSTAQVTVMVTAVNQTVTITADVETLTNKDSIAITGTVDEEILRIEAINNQYSSRKITGALKAGMKYSFLNVPLKEGVNEIKLTSYGINNKPNGKTTLSVTCDQTPPTILPTPISGATIIGKRGWVSSTSTEINPVSVNYTDDNDIRTDTFYVNYYVKNKVTGEIFDYADITSEYNILTESAELISFVYGGASEGYEFVFEYFIADKAGNWSFESVVYDRRYDFDDIDIIVPGVTFNVISDGKTGTYKQTKIQSDEPSDESEFTAHVSISNSVGLRTGTFSGGNIAFVTCNNPEVNCSKNGFSVPLDMPLITGLAFNIEFSPIQESSSVIIEVSSRNIYDCTTVKAAGISLINDYSDIFPGADLDTLYWKNYNGTATEEFTKDWSGPRPSSIVFPVDSILDSFSLFQLKCIPSPEDLYSSDYSFVEDTPFTEDIAAYFSHWSYIDFYDPNDPGNYPDYIYGVAPLTPPNISMNNITRSVSINLPFALLYPPKTWNFGAYPSYGYYGFSFTVQNKRDHYNYGIYVDSEIGENERLEYIQAWLSLSTNWSFNKKKIEMNIGDMDEVVYKYNYIRADDSPQTEYYRSEIEREFATGEPVEFSLLEHWCEDPYDMTIIPVDEGSLVHAKRLAVSAARPGIFFFGPSNIIDAKF